MIITVVVVIAIVTVSRIRLSSAGQWIREEDSAGIRTFRDLTHREALHEHTDLRGGVHSGGRVGLPVCPPLLSRLKLLLWFIQSSTDVLWLRIGASQTVVGGGVMMIFVCRPPLLLLFLLLLLLFIIIVVTLIILLSR